MGRKGGIMDILCKGMSEHLGQPVTRLNTGARLIQSERQAKYADTRQVERNYTRGKGNALKEVGRD